MRTKLMLALLFLMAPYVSHANEGGCSWQTIGGCDGDGGTPPTRICPIGQICPMKVAETEIRLIVDKSGPGAAQGMRVIDGARLAAEDVRDVLKNIRISERDDGCDPSRAHAEAVKALNDGVALVIGHGCGLTASRAADVYRSKVVFLSLGASGENSTPNAAELRFALSPTVAGLRGYGKALPVGAVGQIAAVICEAVRESKGLKITSKQADSEVKPSGPWICDRPLFGDALMNSKVQELSKRLGHSATSDTLKGYSAFFAASAAVHLANSGSQRKPEDVLGKESFNTGFGKFSFKPDGFMSPFPLLMLVHENASIDPNKLFAANHIYGPKDDSQVRGRTCKRLSCEVASSCTVAASLPTCNKAAVCSFECF